MLIQAKQNGESKEKTNLLLPTPSLLVKPFLELLLPSVVAAGSISCQATAAICHHRQEE